MKHIRTYLTGLLAAVLLLCLLPLRAEAAGVSFSGASSIRTGNSVTVTLSISGSGVYGVSAKLSYDTSRLTLTGVKQLVGSSWFVDISGGNLVAYDQKLSSPVSGGLLAVTFQVKSGLSAGTELRASFTDVVTSDQNGQEQSLGSATWTASVAAPLSSDCRLSSLSCDAALSPSFSPDVTQYSLTVPYSVTRLTLQYRTADSGADVSISGNQLSVGSNTVVLTVTAADGSTRRYTLSVTRQPDPNVVLSSDAALAELEPSTGQLSPAFDPDCTDYVIYVPYEVRRLTFAATARDSKALNVTQPGGALEEGDNLFTVTCTAEDGSTRDYLIHVCRMPLFAGTLPQIGDPEPVEQQPVEPEPEELGTFQAAWAALLAPVDLSSLPLLQDRWLPLYALVIAALVLVLILIFFLGRASGVASVDRRGKKLWAKMAAYEAEQAAGAEPAPEPESDGQPEAEAEAPAEQPEPPEPEPVAEPETEPATEEETEIRIDLPVAPAREPVPEAAAEAPAEQPEPEKSADGEEPGKRTLDRMALDELLDEIKNMQM